MAHVANVPRPAALAAVSAVYSLSRGKVFWNRYPVMVDQRARYLDLNLFVTSQALDAHRKAARAYGNRAIMVERQHALGRVSPADVARAYNEHYYELELLGKK